MQETLHVIPTTFDLKLHRNIKIIRPFYICCHLPKERKKENTIFLSISIRKIKPLTKATWTGTKGATIFQELTTHYCARDRHVTYVTDRWFQKNNPHHQSLQSIIRVKKKQCYISKALNHRANQFVLSKSLNLPTCNMLFIKYYLLLGSYRLTNFAQSETSGTHMCKICTRQFHVDPYIEVKGQTEVEVMWHLCVGTLSGHPDLD